MLTVYSSGLGFTGIALQDNRKGQKTIYFSAFPFEREPLAG